MNVFPAYNQYMVYLVIGKKNIGKTTRLRKLFEQTPEAWGFCSEKIHDCGRVTSYELINLRTGDTKTIARLLSLPTPKDWGDEIHHGPFRFALDGFSWAMNVLDEAVKAGAPAFFIDELGKLELNGTGLHEVVEKALKADMDVYISVRDRNVDDAIAAFGISSYEVVTARD